MSAPGHFVWFDLMSCDVEKTMSFFTKLFGYELARGEGTGEDGSRPYVVFKLPDRAEALCGCVPVDKDADEQRSHWIGYLTVDDVEATCATVTEGGGAIRVPPQAPPHAPDTPAFAVVQDAQGAVFAPYAVSQVHGLPAFPPPTGQVAWLELATSDRAGSAALYAQLVGWSTAAEIDLGEDGGADALMRGDQAIGMVRDMLVGSPVGPMWTFHIRVDDIDAICAKAKELGGFLYDGPSDVPGGRRAVLVDPTGAPVGVWQPA